MTAISREERLKKLDNYQDFHSYFIENLRQDPRNIETYLKVALEDYRQDRDTPAFLLALRTIVEAQETMTDLAQKTQLSRQALYKALSLKGNPKFETLLSILNALGYTFDIKPLASKEKKLTAKKSRKSNPRAKAAA